MFEVFFGLFVILLVVTLVGHAIWAFVAFMIRTLAGGDDRPSDPRGKATKPCPFCGHLTPAGHQRCDACGRTVASPLAREVADLDAVERQLERFREKGTLKPEVIARLHQRLRSYRKELFKPPKPRAASQPPEEPVAVEVVSEPEVPKEAAVPKQAASPPLPRRKPAAPGKPEPAKPLPEKRVAAKPAPAKSKTAPKPRPAPVVEPTPPRPPRKPWRVRFAELLADRDIHWTEAIGVLVGGLLMVCSSVMLVVSLWSTLEQIPPLKFFIFVGYSAVVFSAGLYAYHRWKLPSTGRGLLLIATLLVPLDFLAMASLRHGGVDLLTIAAELISVGVCLWLVWMAARVLVPNGTWLTVTAVVGNSGLLLLLGRLTGDEPSAAALLTVGCLPVALFAAAVFGYLATASRREKELGADGANALFTLLGTSTFAAAAALVPAVARGVNTLGPAAVTDLMAVPLALAALPILAVGLRAMRGTQSQKSLAGHHTAGTLVALVGMAATLTALWLAWPLPLGVMTVGLVSAAGLAWAAWRNEFPVFHAGAVVCFGLAYVVGVHWCFEETLRSPAARDALGLALLKHAVSARTGTALAGLVALLAAVREALTRAGRRDEGRVYAAGAGVAVMLGLVLVTVHGFLGAGADAVRAAVLYAIYGGLSLMLGLRLRRVELNYLGLGLLAAAPFWALWWQRPEVTPAWPSLLAAEALLLGVLGFALSRLARPSMSGSADGTSGRVALPALSVAEVLAPLAIGLTVVLAFRAALEQPVAIGHSPWTIATTACLGVFYLLAAWQKRSPGRTWAASMVVLAGLVHALALNYPDLVTQRWLVPLLVHATAAIAAAIALDVWAGRRGDAEFSDRVGRVFGTPGSDSGVLSSLLALVAIPFAPWGSTATLAGCLGWLAIVWLAIAWRERNPTLFAAHQAMFTLAALVGTTAWLERQTWFGELPDALLHPYSLQAFGVVLALLSLLWLAVRIVFREYPAARRLLEPGWPTVDFLVRHAVVWGQFVLAAWWIIPGIAGELLPNRAAAGAIELAAFGPGAWLLLGLTAVVLIASLWQRWWTAEMLAATALAATLALLAAGQFAPQQAAASAVRWSGSVVFLLGSLAVWQRQRLSAWSRALQTRVDLRDDAPPLARGSLVALTALPVLVVTVLAAGLQLAGVSATGPAAGSAFAGMGPAMSYLVPLMLVILTLVGHAVRERSSGYAFSAGLVAELAVVLGYALHVTSTGNQKFDVAEIVMLLQLATIAAAGWAAAWLGIRRRLDVWREGPMVTRSRRLMDVQFGLGAAGNLLLLTATLALVLVIQPTDRLFGQWTAAVGSSWGWIALAAVVGAWAFRRIEQRRSLRPAVVGLVGMGLLELLACAVGARFGGWWGYRTLMLSWAAYAWFIAAATWWVASARAVPEGHGPPQTLVRAAAVWVRAAGLLAVLLGLRAAVFREADVELLWSAAAVSLASLAGATMAVWRRREGWALSAALGVNLAASLVVWYARPGQPLDDWWLQLVQANVIASATVALAWLGVRRRLYMLRELDLRHTRLLAVQTVLPVVGNLALLAIPLPLLLFATSDLPTGVAQLAEWPGWLALVLSAAAAAWYLHQVMPQGMTHVLAGLGLAAGVLLACGAAADATTPWNELHLLLAAWAAVALAVLGFGMAGRKLAFFPAETVRGWVTLIGGLVIYLTLAKAAQTTVGFWWSARALLAVSLAFAFVALWLRRPGYVFACGLLLNVIGVIGWTRAADGSFYDLASVNVVCLAVGTVLWTLLDRFLPGGVPHARTAGVSPYAHLAARAAFGLMAGTVGFALVGELLEGTAYLVTRLDWTALGVLVAAMTVLLWDRTSRLPLAGLYAAGVLAVAMMHLAGDLAPQELVWKAGFDLAAVGLAAALAGRLLPLLDAVWQALGIPQTIEDSRPRWSADWFHAAQATVIALAASLSAWIALDGRFDGLAGILAGRTSAAGAALMLALATLVMTRCCAQHLATGQGPMLQGDGRRRAWQVAALAGGALVFAATGWSLLDAASAAYWLHVEVVLLVAAAVMTLAAGIGLPKFVSPGSDWIEAGRRAAPALGGLAGIALVGVLLHEIALFATVGEAPLSGPAIGVVAGSLAALVVGCLAFALKAEWDPLKLSESGRQAYIYGAEVLGALVGLHLYLTMPWLFQLGFVEQYWMLIIMAVAFAGAGLSELFHRRGLPVLSKPLERTALALPLAPAAGFWLVQQTSGAAVSLAGPSPAMWLLMGAFYGMMARMRGSLGCGAASIVSGTIGVWVLWARLDIDIARHPQLWLIPPALAALVAEYLNRDRLSAAGSAAFRYLALGIIYVSSTADMFIAGIGEDWRLPLALMLLSVAGILAGFLLRVQSFLLLGLVFLVVDLAAMIGYAAFGLKQMWVLWACCIVVGAGIIALFGVFERRRQAVLGAVDRFRQWER